MPKSAAFIRIKGQVLEITAAIPIGRLCTFQSIGEHLDVMPRHVAYILSQLDDSAKMVYPWHRVVASDGLLGVSKRSPGGETQGELLRREGINVAKNKVSPDLSNFFVPAASLPHGIPPQSRPTSIASMDQRTERRHAKGAA